jgi:hypothetical protein
MVQLTTATRQVSERALTRRASRFSAPSGFLSASEEPVPGVAKSRKDVACSLRPRSSDAQYTTTSEREPLYPSGAATRHMNRIRVAGALERRCRDSRFRRSRHRIEQKEVAFRCIARHLEVIVHRFERVVVAIEADVSGSARPTKR